MKQSCRCQNGMSLVPVLVLSGLIAFFVISNSVNMGFNQKNLSNINAQSIVEDVTRNEVNAQIQFYADPDRLQSITTSGTSISQQSTPSSGLVVGGSIQQLDYLTSCPGSSWKFKCANYTLVVESDMNNLLAKKKHQITTQVVVLE